MRRLRRLWLVPAVALLGAPAPAEAALLGLDPAARELNYFASPGEANRLAVTASGSQLLVSDTGAPIEVLGGCQHVAGDPHRVRCPLGAVGKMTVDLIDLDDQATIAAGPPVLMTGGDGNDVLRTGGGSDRLDGGPGSDVLDGGGGRDRLYADVAGRAGTPGVRDRLAGGPGRDRLEGAAGEDALGGGAGGDTLLGGDGRDTIQGAGGRDRLSGGDADDVLDGGAGDDRVGSSQASGVGGQSRERGSDVVQGGPGDDRLFPGPGPSVGPDADRLAGGDGTDTVSYDGRMVGIQASKDDVQNDGGLGERDALGADVERVEGSQRDDRLTGGDGPDTLVGGPGDDRLDGLEGRDVVLGDGARGAGSDIVAGGDGRDRVRGNRGDDVLDGGAADDRLDGGGGRDTAAFPAGGVTVALGRGRATTGGGEADTVARLENVAGGRRDDTVTGNRRRNVLRGARGEDYLSGGRGTDRLAGGAGADMLAARDGRRDRVVECGRGVDFAIVDERDRAARRGPNRCERIDDGTRRRPDAGSEVYAEPERCRSPLEVDLPRTSRSVPLEDAVVVPSGAAPRRRTEFDASTCGVDLTVSGTRSGASGTAAVSGTSFGVAPARTAAAAVDLVVARPACAGTAQAQAAGSRRRRLRVRRRRGRGRWRVIGGYSNGASYSTDWTTIEACDRTITIVHEGHVGVFDKVRNVVVRVGPGESYTALAPAAASAGRPQ